MGCNRHDRHGRDFDDDFRHDFDHDFDFRDFDRGHRREHRREFEEMEPFPFDHRRERFMRHEFRRFPREEVFFIGFPPRRSR